MLTQIRNPLTHHPCLLLCSGGKLLRRLSNFQKTVSCVRLSPLAGPDSAAAPRLLAGSLDGHVKVFELNDFKVTSASKYPAPVLSMGISPDCSLLAVGMADGMLSVRKHARPKPVQVGGVKIVGARRALGAAKVVLGDKAMLRDRPRQPYAWQRGLQCAVRQARQHPCSCMYV